MSGISLSVFVVNFNTKDLVIAAVQSLLDQEGLGFEIIVVDNASQDGSQKALKESFGDRIHLIESPENLGFGRANNLAASKARGEYFYLLNPDARLDSPEGLKHLLTYLQENPAYGLVGTAIHEPSRSRWILPNTRYPAEQHLRYTQKLKSLPGKIAWVLGASMAIPRKVYEGVKGFDPDFFLYGEETDLCLRIREAGFEIGYCADVLVEHVGSASEKSAAPKATWLRKQKGHFLFCQKHYDPRDVTRLAKLAIRRAKRKLFFYAIQSLFGKKNQAKRDRLHAVIEVAEAVDQKKVQAGSSAPY